MHYSKPVFIFGIESLDLTELLLSGLDFAERHFEHCIDYDEQNIYFLPS